MKKTLLLVALCVAAIGAKAQNASYGIKAGMNLSNQTLGNTNELVGYQIGVFAEYPISRHFAIQPGLQFTTKGWETKLTNTRQQSNYLEMPLMLVYKMPISRTSKLTFNAGPYLGYGVYGKSTTAGVTVTTMGHSLNRWDFGLGGGVGMEFGKIVLNLGYEYSLSDVYNGPGPHGYNMNAAFTVGYRF